MNHNLIIAVLDKFRGLVSPILNKREQICQEQHKAQKNLVIEKCTSYILQKVCDAIS